MGKYSLELLKTHTQAQLRQILDNHGLPWEPEMSKKELKDIILTIPEEVASEAPAPEEPYMGEAPAPEEPYMGEAPAPEEPYMGEVYAPEPELPKAVITDIIAQRRAQTLAKEQEAIDQEFARAQSPVAQAIAQRRAQAANLHRTTSVEDALATRRAGGQASFAEVMAKRRREALARGM